MEEFLPVSAQVNLSAIANNIRELRRITSPGARLMAVLKANGYGHGAVPVAKTALENGADFLGVARLEEALTLRQAGISAPTLIFGAAFPHWAEELARHGIAGNVTGFESARALSEAACAKGIEVIVHIKVDTGMGRLGIVAGNPTSENPPPDLQAVVAEIKAIKNLPNLNCQGMFTHMADADGPTEDHYPAQMRFFTDLLTALEQEGVHFPIVHGANSAVTLRCPDFHLDMVRPGMAVYGLPVLPEGVAGPANLRPAMALVSRVTQVKNADPGFGVSYNIRWRAGRPSVLATVSIGYGDGLPRMLSNRGHMMVRGKKVPMVGRVCMDMCMLDVTDVPETKVGDPVLVFGEKDGQSLPAGELAKACGTIHYELLAGLAARVPRIYVTD